MGNELSEIDEKNLQDFADYILNHFDYKKNLQTYLKDQMSNVAPNLTVLLGESIGARLLTHAGGLNNLSKLPASTIQILGAEKALFRALKTKSATPKYGLLYNSSYITRAEVKSKGKISRILANKCALASKLDNFLIQPTEEFGKIFKQQVEDKIAEPNNDELGKRNIMLMEDLVEHLKENGDYTGEEKPEAKPKSKGKAKAEVVPLPLPKTKRIK
jgi:nucleolar protein 56